MSFYVVTGSTSPNVDGNYIEAGVYSGQPYYQLDGGVTYLWWYPAAGQWVLNDAVGVWGFSRWLGQDGTITGNYTAIGTVGDVSVAWVFEPSGGVLVGGVAKSVFGYITSGGVVAGGSAEIEFEDNIEPSGGVVAGGSAIVSLITTQVPSGGVVVNGTAPNAYSYAISGGVVVSGEATVDDSWYAPSGGGEGGTESLGLSEDELDTHTFSSEKTFEYHAGPCVPFYWQVESRCRPIRCIIWTENQWKPIEYEPGTLPTEECDRKQIAVIMACSLKEVCIKLKEKGFIFPVDRIVRFTQPARTGDSANPNHFDGCGTYVQVYPPLGDDEIDLPLECLDFLLEGETKDVWGWRDSAEFAGDVDEDGGIIVGGSADIKVSYYKMEGEGGIVVGGTSSRLIEPVCGSFDSSFSSAFDSCTAEDQSEFISWWGLKTELLSMEGEFTTVEGDPLLTSTGVIVDECSCDIIPIAVDMTHNLNDSLKIQQFLTRNGKTLPEKVMLYHNSVNYSWQCNLHYQGWASDGMTQETWNFMFEWACVGEVGQIPLGNIWKWTMYIKQKNLTTGEDFDTRVLLVFEPSKVCPPYLGLRHRFTLNTEELTWSLATPPGNYDANILFNVCTDNGGIFKSPQWLRNPLLRIGIYPGTTPNKTTVVNINDIFKDRTILVPRFEGVT